LHGTSIRGKFSLFGVLKARERRRGGNSTPWLMKNLITARRFAHVPNGIAGEDQVTKNAGENKRGAGAHGKLCRFGASNAKRKEGSPIGLARGIRKRARG